MSLTAQLVQSAGTANLIAGASRAGGGPDLDVKQSDARRSGHQTTNTNAIVIPLCRTVTHEARQERRWIKIIQ